MPLTAYLTPANTIGDIRDTTNRIIDLLETYNSASNMSFVPSGNLSANASTVQTAIIEAQSDFYTTTNNIANTISNVTSSFSANVTTINANITSNVNLLLAQSSNLADLSDVSAASSNLSLGTASVIDAGSNANNIYALDVVGNGPTVDGRLIQNINSTRNRMYAHSARINQHYPVETLSANGVSAPIYIADGVGISCPAGSTGTLKGGTTRVLRAPSGSVARYRVMPATTTTSFSAATSAATVYFCLEGSDIQDFKMGTINSNHFTFAFVVNAPAGTYSVAFRNSGTTRCYVTTFTISTLEANKDKSVAIVVPCDQTGTYVIDSTSFGIIINICFGQGSTYSTSVLNSWQNGNFLGASGVNSNFMANAANVFYICDLGVYLNVSNPQYTLIPFQDELTQAQRFFQQAISTVQDASPGGRLSTWYTKVSMRAQPTAIVSYAGTAGNANTVFNGTAVFPDTGYADVSLAVANDAWSNRTYLLTSEF